MISKLKLEEMISTLQIMYEFKIQTFKQGYDLAVT